MNTTNIRRRIHPKNSFGIVVLSKDVLLVERIVGLLTIFPGFQYIVGTRFIASKNRRFD